MNEENLGKKFEEIFKENPLTISGAIIGGMVGSFAGAILGGLVGIILDENLNK